MTWAIFFHLHPSTRRWFRQIALLFLSQWSRFDPCECRLALFLSQLNFFLKKKKKHWRQLQVEDFKFLGHSLWRGDKIPLKGSVERSRHERHFCSLLPYFLLSWLQIFQLCLSFCTASPDLVLFKKFLQEKEKHPKTTQNALAPGIFIVLSIGLKLGTPLLHTQAQNKLLQIF